MEVSDPDAVCDIAQAIFARHYPGEDLAPPVRAFADALDLLRQTPAFMDDAIATRLDRVFEGVHRYVAVHFGGRNPYLESVDRQRVRLLEALRNADADALRRSVHLADVV